MSSPLSVRILRTLPELEEVRQVWQSWPGNRDSEMESYTTFVQSNGKTLRPHVLVVYRGGMPDAIWVGRLDEGYISCKLGYLNLKFPARIISFVNGALRGNASHENCDLLTSEVLRSLSVGEAHAACLQFVKRGSDLCRLATTKPPRLCRDHLRTPLKHFAALLPGTVEEFYRGLSSGARWQIKAKQKKLLRDFAGDIEIRCFRNTAELEDLMRDVETVAKKTYQRGLGVGFSDGPKIREQFRLKAERGWLRAYVLYIAGRPSAFWIGDINGTTFGSDYLGYDPEFERYSPGMCLMAKVIEGFCDGGREGISEVDFATGHAQYKEVLSNQGWEEESIYIFSPSIKGVVLNLTRTVVGRIDQGVKSLLSSTNLLRRVKKAWRVRAQKTVTQAPS